MSSAIRFWDRFANRYSKQSISNPEAYERKLGLTQRYLTEQSNVLEFGCGTGSTALIHAPRVKHLLAIDFSTKMIEIGEQKASEAHLPNLEFRCTTLFDLPADDQSYDAVLALNVLHLMDDPRAAIQRVHRLLKPGGIFVSSTACISEMPAWLHYLLPAGGALGLIPKLQCFTRTELNTWISGGGFEVIERLEPTKKSEAIFLIARKISRSTGASTLAATAASASVL